ncbi:pimeloyl-ACP methyl ester carboxylesterase [Crossiella equi]|uniref:Pimeloyl-ACP methyl ester carboxylesterase n=1 Tax=Crossiella equi TaxID=130796 RepID=A0ABS5AD79_9PSEU|nr:alpha/beta hydrolase [Crossiella equi]MBP2474524.1 pimeloyl-ACP methyl ester carboxylesterase [Crossiella equi]
MIGRRTFTLGALTALGTLGLAGTGTAAPGPRVRNVVLVHGAYADGSSWAPVVTRLQQAGLRVTSVQNPLTSLAEDVAATTRALDRQDGPTVLAGHSYGGMVVSQAGGHPRVASLVYVAARAPEAGEDYPALAARFPTPPANAGIVERAGFRQLSQEAFLRDFANGLPRHKALALYAAQGPVAASLFTTRTTAAAWHEHPTFYAVSRRDRTTSPELQRFLAGRMGAHTVELDSGHLSIQTHPDEIARLVLAAAR